MFPWLREWPNQLHLIPFGLLLLAYSAIAWTWHRTIDLWYRT